MDWTENEWKVTQCQKKNKRKPRDLLVNTAVYALIHWIIALVRGTGYSHLIRALVSDSLVLYFALQREKVIKTDHGPAVPLASRFTVHFYFLSQPE